MGKKKPDLPANWDTVFYDNMNEIVHAEFSVPELSEKLIAKGGAYLEEGTIGTITVGAGAPVKSAVLIWD